ncbi:MAG: hypothetical protein ABSG90_09350 [Dehalococcoidia bacterium]|jgi:hypothetical protein
MFKIVSQMPKGILVAAVVAVALVTASLVLVACTAARANPVAADPTTAPQAEFKVIGLGVNPSQVGPGEKVFINAKIANTGGADGTYNAQLKVNGVVEAVGNVDIPAGGSRDVTFNTSKDSVQSYTVSLDQMAGQFDVVATQSTANTPLAAGATASNLPACCQPKTTTGTASSTIGPVAGASCCGGAQSTPNSSIITQRSCCGQ